MSDVWSFGKIGLDSVKSVNVRHVQVCVKNVFFCETLSHEKRSDSMYSAVIYMLDQQATNTFRMNTNSVIAEFFVRDFFFRTSGWTYEF